MKTTKKLLFLTRKYPPSVGGMENALYEISRLLPDENLSIKIVALGKKQYHLIWFFPYLIFYTLFHVHSYDYLFLGDGLICMCGAVAKWVAPKVKRMTLLHGLDVSYANPLYQFYLRMNLKKSSDAFACNSVYTANIAKNWGLPEQKVFTLTLGVNVDLYKGFEPISKQAFMQKYAISENNLVIITTGRLVKRKGVAWFIRNVLPALTSVTYLVIGAGEEQEDIENAIRETNQADNVRLLGKISDEDLKNCYLNGDVFAMPNFHVEDNAEGFGLVAIEASLAGLIVLASEVDGIPDAIQNGKNGHLLPPLDSEAYVKAVKDVQSNLDAYKAEAKTFQKFTYDTYSWNHTCACLKERLYSL